jgi:hypothetical protein
MTRSVPLFAILAVATLPPAVLAAPGKEPPKLANREAVAKALPQGLTLATKFRDVANQRTITTVERKLAELKAQVGKDGKLRTGVGKLIFFYQGLRYQGARPAREDVERERKLHQKLVKMGTVIEMAPITPPK